MNKFLRWSIFIFIVYGLFIAWYLYFGSTSTLPDRYVGTAADPSQFMNERQLELSYDYSRIKHIIFFVKTPFEWIVLFSILSLGISSFFRNWARGMTKIPFLQHVIYVFLYTFLTSLVMFPLQWGSYQISKVYGISNASFPVWMKDQILSFWLDYLLMTLTVIVIYACIQKFGKRWWLYVWLISIPFTLFIMFIKPVIIDPLYNDFYPLKDKVLEEKILNLADQAGIPTDHVYEVNMSEKTNALNAYVTGIGSNSRIVLWDTTLQKLSDQEVLFIMAHEMGHYVKKHIYVGIFSYLCISLFGFYLTSKLFTFLIHRYGGAFGITSEKDVATLPLLLLIFTMLSFAVSPFSNAFSRYQEHTADVYAIELTKDSTAAVQSFQKLAVTSLSEVNPPVIVKWFRYGHPTLLERIYFLESFEAKPLEEVK